MRSALLLTLALALILPLAALRPAVAQALEDRQATVSLKGLDLNSRGGAMTFLNRLSVAAAKVCGSVPDIRELGRADAFNACVARTKADAVAHLDNAEVSAIARGASQEAATVSAKPKI